MANEIDISYIFGASIIIPNISDELASWAFCPYFYIFLNDINACGGIVLFAALKWLNFSGLGEMSLIDFAFDLMIVFEISDSFSETLLKIMFVYVIGWDKIFGNCI